MQLLAGLVIYTTRIHYTAWMDHRYQLYVVCYSDEVLYAGDEDESSVLLMVATYGVCYIVC